MLLELFFKMPMAYKLKCSNTHSMFLRMAGSVYIYSADDNHLIKRFIHPRNPCDIAFSGNDENLAIINTTGKISIIDIKTMEETRELTIKIALDGKLAYCHNDLLICSYGKVWVLPQDETSPTLLLSNSNANYAFCEVDSKEVLIYDEATPNTNYIFCYNYNEGLLTKKIDKCVGRRMLSLEKVMLTNKYGVTLNSYIVPQETLIISSSEEFNSIKKYIEEVVEKIDCDAERQYYTLSFFALDFSKCFASIHFRSCVKSISISHDFRFVALFVNETLCIWDIKEQKLVMNGHFEFFSDVNFWYKDSCSYVAVSTWKGSYIYKLDP